MYSNGITSRTLSLRSGISKPHSCRGSWKNFAPSFAVDFSTALRTRPAISSCGLQPTQTLRSFRDGRSLQRRTIADLRSVRANCIGPFRAASITFCARIRLSSTCQQGHRRDIGMPVAAVSSALRRCVVRRLRFQHRTEKPGGGRRARAPGLETATFG